MNARGFTLLETMVALTILGLVVVGYLEIFGASARSANRVEHWVEAVAYAEAGMEMAKLGAGRETEPLPDGFSRRVATRAWRDGLAVVTVTVTFPDGGRFALERLVAAP